MSVGTYASSQDLIALQTLVAFENAALCLRSRTWEPHDGGCGQLETAKGEHFPLHSYLSSLASQRAGHFDRLVRRFVMPVQIMDFGHDYFW